MTATTGAPHRIFPRSLASLLLLASDRQCVLTVCSRMRERVLTTCRVRTHTDVVWQHHHTCLQVCEVFIMTSWMKFPQYLDKSYSKLVFKWSGDITKEKMHNSLNHPDPSLPVGCHHCGFHEEKSCLQYLFWDFLKRWQQHSTMYVPLYLVPRLLMRGRTLVEDPLSFVGPYVHDVLVSGLFLSTYVVAAKSVICLHRAFFAATNQMTLAATVCASAATGPSVLWERPSRRIELLLYVTQRVRLWRVSVVGCCLALRTGGG